ncbi:MAG: hypothetical protein N2036_02375 [Bryobacteraceae bacterium]|nr:hypothetical protein [Bryobacteraceae bacterium]
MRCVLALLLAVPLAANPLPQASGESLAGQKVVLPDAFLGQPAVVIWSFSREAGELTAQWAAPLARDRVNVWSAAVIEAAPRLIRPMIRSGMRRSSPPPFHPRFLCITSGEKQLRQALAVQDDRLPIVTLLDAQGSVVWRHAGPYSQAADAELRRRISETR